MVPNPIITGILAVVLILSSTVIGILILMHKGRGGGITSLFGGGLPTPALSSSVAEKNLDKLTIITGVVWISSIIAVGLLIRS